MATVIHPTMARGMASANHYHQWVFDSFKNNLNRGGITLEIGAGHSGYTKQLLSISEKVIATDIDEKALAKIKNDLSQLNSLEVLRMDGLERRLIPEPVSNIVAINIMEHIEHDDVFVKNAFEVLASGGKLVVLAPAFQFLFSNIDKEAGHYRRYEKKQLERCLLNFGFAIRTSRYFNLIGFFGWLVNKWFSSGVDSRSTNFQVSVFDKLVWLFKWLDWLFPFCGQSLLIVGEKKDKR